MRSEKDVNEAVMTQGARLEFVSPYDLQEAKERIRSALVPAPRLYFFLIPRRGDWPISGRVSGNGFQIRTRSAWSNGSNVVWALGKFETDHAMTKVRVRFVPEPIGTFGVASMLVVIAVLFAIHSWLAWALLAFVILAVGIAIPVARSERDALARFMLDRLQ
jgi:hypothetical protein